LAPSSFDKLRTSVKGIGCGSKPLILSFKTLILTFKSLILSSKPLILSLSKDEDTRCDRRLSVG